MSSFLFYRNNIGTLDVIFSLFSHWHLSWQTWFILDWAEPRVSFATCQQWGGHHVVNILTWIIVYVHVWQTCLNQVFTCIKIFFFKFYILWNTNSRVKIYLEIILNVKYKQYVCPNRSPEDGFKKWNLEIVKAFNQRSTEVGTPVISFSIHNLKNDWNIFLWHHDE